MAVRYAFSTSKPLQAAHHSLLLAAIAACPNPTVTHQLDTSLVGDATRHGDVGDSVTGVDVSDGDIPPAGDLSAGDGDIPPAGDLSTGDASSTEAGFIVSAFPDTLEERGAAGALTVSLSTAPIADVLVAVLSSDESEILVSPASLSFTKADWDNPQTVMVTPVDDWVPDGAQHVSILLGAPESIDPAYSRLGQTTAGELSLADDDSGGGYNLRTTHESSGLPFYVAHSYYHGVIANLTDRTNWQQPGDFEWRIVPGLANPDDPSLVSFVSPSFPGRYLRIDGANPTRFPSGSEGANYEEYLSSIAAEDRHHLAWLDAYEDSDTFRHDATFRVVAALNGDDSMVSFRWYGDPTPRYLRHYFYQVFATEIDGSTQQKEDASFTLEPLGFLVARRADPHITRHTDGYYYMTASVPEYDRIEIRRATTLRGLAAAEPTVVWAKHATGEMGAHIWAPELHHIDDAWYIYFAAGRTDNVWAIRMYVLETSAANPIDGTWEERGKIATPFDTFSLDATTFEHDGTRYLVWAQEDPAVIGDSSSLFIAAMSNPWTITGTPVRIARPDYAWEKVGFEVNEGAAILVRNGRVFVTYSASATDANYCIGLLTASATSDLLDPSSWTKSTSPVFENANGLFGPGHNSFTTSPDGSVDLLVYHARNYEAIVGEPLYDGNRHTRVQRLHWNPDGTPDFDQPRIDGFDTIGE
jgi:GH43 family beta-xylosidase